MPPGGDEAAAALASKLLGARPCQRCGDAAAVRDEGRQGSRCCTVGVACKSRAPMKEPVGDDPLEQGEAEGPLQEPLDVALPRAGGDTASDAREPPAASSGRGASGAGRAKSRRRRPRKRASGDSSRRTATKGSTGWGSGRGCDRLADSSTSNGDGVGAALDDAEGVGPCVAASAARPEAESSESSVARARRRGPPAAAAGGAALRCGSEPADREPRPPPGLQTPGLPDLDVPAAMELGSGPCLSRSESCQPKVGGRASVGQEALMEPSPRLGATSVTCCPRKLHAAEWEARLDCRHAAT